MIPYVEVYELLITVILLQLSQRLRASLLYFFNSNSMFYIFIILLLVSQTIFNNFCINSIVSIYENVKNEFLPYQLGCLSCSFLIEYLLE